MRPLHIHRSPLWSRIRFAQRNRSRRKSCEDTMVRLIDVIDRGSPFFSFVIGLGLAAILFPRKYDSIRTLALPLTEATERIVRSDGKCYRYRVEDAQCESSD